MSSPLAAIAQNLRRLAKLVPRPPDVERAINVGPLIEYYDPDWGSYCSPLPGAHIENITSDKPAGDVVQLKPRSKGR